MNIREITYKIISHVYVLKFYNRSGSRKEVGSGIGGAKGNARDAWPHLDPISFILMQFSGKNWPNDRLVPSLS